MDDNNVVKWNKSIEMNKVIRYKCMIIRHDKMSQKRIECHSNDRKTKKLWEINDS